MIKQPNESNENIPHTHTHTLALYGDILNATDVYRQREKDTLQFMIGMPLFTV